MDEAQRNRVGEDEGFVAALDQSGGSTPKALEVYGVRGTFATDQAMFDAMHRFRERLILSSSFDKRILAAILFEKTLNRTVGGEDVCRFLWERKGIVSFVKIDHGLLPVDGGVQLMRPIANLDGLLERATALGVFGTKARSLILDGSPDGIRAVAEQQFEVGRIVSRAGLVPILEPEVSIENPEKRTAELTLRGELFRLLSSFEAPVIFKLTLPSEDGLYQEFVDHPQVLRVVALSGGYDRSTATARLSRNPGVIASFSRALVEGLKVDMSDDEFDRQLDESVAEAFDASTT